MGLDAPCSVEDRHLKNKNANTGVQYRFLLKKYL